MADGYAVIDKSNWYPGTHYFTQISDHDHSGWLYIITLLSLVYVIIVFIIRFIVKYGTYGHDDGAVFLSTVLAIAQYIIMLVAMSKGLGKAVHLLSIEALTDIRRYAAAHAWLYILSLTASKVSTAMLTQRLYDNGRTRNIYFCWALVMVAMLFGVACIMCLGIRCQNAGYVLIEEQCHHRFLRWEMVMATDIITEALLVIVPVGLLLDILIKPAAKVTVLAVFGVRLFDIFFACVNLHNIRRLRNAKDLAMAVTDSLIWTQTELLWSIFSASLPCLKTFMRPLDKIDENTWRSNHYRSSPRSDRSWHETRDKEGALPLQDLEARKGGIVVRSACSDSIELRLDAPVHEVHISGPDTISEEIRGSWGSEEQPIIKKSERWEVTREPSRRGSMRDLTFAYYGSDDRV